MSEKKLDFTKPLQTRDGRPVRIYATDAGGEYSVHGAVLVNGKNQPDFWTLTSWRADGRKFKSQPSDSDLVPAPETHIRQWIEVYYLDIIGKHLLTMNFDGIRGEDAARDFARRFSVVGRFIGWRHVRVVGAVKPAPAAEAILKDSPGLTEIKL